MAIQTPIESLPLFLQQIFRERGVYPELNTGVDQSSSVNSFVPPRRRRLNTGEDLGGEDFQQESPVTTAASGDLLDTLRGLFSSEDPYDPEANMYYSLQENQTSGNSFIDGATNLVSGIGQSVTDSFSKLGGLFNTDNTAGALSAYGGNVPSIMGRINPAFDDDRLSSGRLLGQGLGTGLLGVANQAVPGVNILGLGGRLLSNMGFHHDYNPSRDANLNFDVTSGRFEWDSLDPGAGGVQYGSKANEQMIIDEANENPHERFNVTWQDEKGNQKTGNISFGEAKNVLGISNDPFFTGDINEVWDAFTLSGPTFGSQSGLGYGSNQGDMNDYDAYGTGDIWNSVASSVYDQGGSYNDIRGPADTARAAYDLGIAPTQSAIDAMVDDSLSGKETWDSSTLALASQPDLIYDIDVGAGGSVDGGSTETIDGESFDFDSDFSGFGW